MSEVQERILNWKKGPEDPRDYKSVRRLTAPVQLPSEFELEKQIPIYDQQDIGSCFHGETLVPLLNGNERTLKELSDGVEGEKFWIYSVDPKTGNFIPAEATARKTRKNERTIIIHLDNGKTVRCTPDHEFLSRDGQYIKAENLQIGQSLMPLNRMISEKGYELIFDNSKNKFCYTHWKVKIHFQNRPNRDVIHHVDFNKRNNAPDNLEFMSWIAHRDLHASLGGLNFKNYHGTEKQREDSRRTALKMHRENPGWSLLGCSRGGKQSWVNAQSNPERLEQIFECLNKGRTPEARKKATESLLITIQNRTPERKSELSKVASERIRNDSERMEWCRNQGKKLGGQISNEYQCAKLGSEVLFKFGELNENSWNSVRESYTEYKTCSRTRNNKLQRFISKYNCKPKFQSAIKICKSHDKLVELSQNYNHKVVKVESSDPCDVYCLSVPETENFALSSGIFVHNCVANSAASCYRFESAQVIGNFSFNPSRLFVYYNARKLQGWEKEDSGAYIRDGFKAMNKWGLADEKVWPYVTRDFAKEPNSQVYSDGLNNVIVKYARVSQTETAIKETVLSGAAVSFGFNVYSSFMYGSWPGKIPAIMPLPKASEEILGGHAVTIIGYSDSKKCFLIQNSWGTGWGENGKFWMPYSFVLNSKECDDFWCIETIKISGVNPDPTEFNWLTASKILFKTAKELWALRKSSLVRLGIALQVDGIDENRNFKYNYELVKAKLGL